MRTRRSVYVRKTKVRGKEYLQVVQYYTGDDTKRRLKILKSFGVHTGESWWEAQVFVANLRVVVDFLDTYPILDEFEFLQQMLLVLGGYLGALNGLDVLKWFYTFKDQVIEEKISKIDMKKRWKTQLPEKTLSIANRMYSLLDDLDYSKIPGIYKDIQAKLRESPQNPELLRFAGSCQQLLNNPKSAVQYYLQALEYIEMHSFDFTVIYNNLIGAFYDANMKQEFLSFVKNQGAAWEKFVKGNIKNQPCEHPKLKSMIVELGFIYRSSD
jgi:hypothetical protein